MNNFTDYAYYYDMFYGDKDYAAEADVIDGLINKYSSADAKNILNIGCGTGKHDIELFNRGYQVHGIDLSENMIEVAKSNYSTISGIDFEVGDARTYSSDVKYDVVTSLFHVMSYQNRNEDILNAFSTAGKALKNGGIFIFDSWYGPGVLTDRPSVRVKKVEDSANYFIRYAKPVMHWDKNVVDVCYEVNIIDKKTSVVSTIDEVHSMRYFFYPEVEFYLQQADFEILDCLDCNTLKATDDKSWTAYFIAVKR